MLAFLSALRRVALTGRLSNSSEDVESVQEDQERAFRWCGAMSGGQTLAIMGVNGGVRVRGVEGSEARVVAIRRGSPRAMERVRVAAEQTAGGVTIRAIYPRFRLPYRPPEVAVDFLVEIPAVVGLLVRVGKGGIHLKSVAGDAELHTEDGTVSVSDSGWVSAEAVHGYIHASIREPEWRRPLHFRTADGSIRVELPSNASTRIRARSMNGMVSASFPLMVERKSYNFLSGVLGANDRRELVCECGNGSVHLSQAPGETGPLSILGRQVA